MPDGGASDDQLRGDAGDDGMQEGAGGDQLWGLEGDDTFDTVDGSRDEVYCGDGDDTVTEDSVDDVKGDCENVTGGSPSRADFAPISRVRSTRREHARSSGHPTGLERAHRIAHRFTTPTMIQDFRTDYGKPPFANRPHLGGR